MDIVYGFRPGRPGPFERLRGERPEYGGEGSTDSAVFHKTSF